MSADLRFITDSPKTDPHIFAVKRPGNALSDAGLAGTWGTYKQKDGTGLLLIKSHHSKLLDDPLFYFFRP
mgnify:CR=1 FL=1